MRKTAFLFFAVILFSIFIFTANNSNATIYTINVQSNFFSPTPLNALVGDTIKFQWLSGFHTTTCDPVVLPGTSHPASAADWDSPMNSGSPTFFYIMKVPGTYVYGCQPHWPSMTGTINVGTGYKYWSGSNGGGDGSSWSDPLNWLDGTVPVATDSVKLDNSFYGFTYSVTLPGGIANTQIANIKIYPTLPNLILLTLPATNTSATAGLTVGDGIGSPYDFSISKNGVFINQSGAASGSGVVFINSADSIQLLDSAIWNHNCTRGQAGITNKLSKASNTRLGIFRYDMPTSSFASITFSNITYGSLQLLGVTANAPYPGKKYITTGSSACTVRGNYYVDAFCYDSTVMTNNLNVGGDATIYGKTVFAPITNPRTLNFNGTTLQNIYCAELGAVQTGKVIFNNTAGFVIKNTFSIDSLTMTNGNVATDPTAYLAIGFDVANVGSLTRTGGIVTGRVARWYNSGVTSAALDFPVGNSTTYKKATVAFTTAPANPGYIIMQFVDNGINATDLPIPLTDGAFSLTRRTDSYWLATTSGINGGVTDVSFDGNGQNGITDPANLRVIYSNDGNTFSLQGNHAAGSGTTANRTLVGSYFGRFYLGGNGSVNPLPVELKDFVSTTIKNEVILDWTTGHEHNNNLFEIERANLLPYQDHNSSDLNYIKVGSVPGHGNSNIVQNYKFTDKNSSIGRYAYRLKQIDNNGTHNYYVLGNEVIISNPVSFTVSQNYPNPFNPVTNINYEMPYDGKVKLTVFDNIGREVKTLVNGNVAAGYYKVEFNASSLSSGIYFYRVNATSGTQVYEKVFKMMVVR